MVAAVYFNGKFDVRKIKVDDPVTNRPFTLEFTGERAVGQVVKNTFEFGFCWSGFEAPRIGRIASLNEQP